MKTSIFVVAFFLLSLALFPCKANKNVEKGKALPIHKPTRPSRKQEADCKLCQSLLPKKCSNGCKSAQEKEKFEEIINPQRRTPNRPSTQNCHSRPGCLRQQRSLCQNDARCSRIIKFNIVHTITENNFRIM